MTPGDPNDLAERIIGARVASRARTSTAVDPYVRALAELADLVAEYFRARHAYYSSHGEIGAARAAYKAAEAAVMDAVGRGMLSRIAAAVESLGSEHQPSPYFQREVWARIERERAAATRTSRWRRTWNWLTGRSAG